MGKKKIKTIGEEDEVLEGGIRIPKPKKKKIAQKVSRGKIFIYVTYNNTIISIADPEGRVLAQSSAGRLGFKGAKKSTPFAATQVVKHILQVIEPYEMREADVFVKGVGSGRESAVRSFGSSFIEINSIRDVTPVPHNGCRPRKKRRV